MAYRVFVGPKNSRVFHAICKTKKDAISCLFEYLNLRHFHIPMERDITRKAEMQLLADKERILNTRFKPMPSGLHGPVYSFELGSISK